MYGDDVYSLEIHLGHSVIYWHQITKHNIMDLHIMYDHVYYPVLPPKCLTTHDDAMVEYNIIVVLRSGGGGGVEERGEWKREGERQGREREREGEKREREGGEEGREREGEGRERERGIDGI